MDKVIQEICKICLTNVICFDREIIEMSGVKYIQCPCCMNLIKVE